LTISQILQQFITDLAGTSVYEYIAVFAGVVSVWYSRKENILVYPTGLINTIFYIYLSYKGGLYGEVTVNFYYTIMSIIGWMMWHKKTNNNTAALQITLSTKKEIVFQLLFFVVCFIAIFFVLNYLKENFNKNTIPFADAFATATAFTGMWLMTKKKVESWYWWIATNLASIPLYFVKHYVFTSVYYIILLIMAFMGLAEWFKRVNKKAHLL
jgi:nicotinamide mononucleotide transporter